MFEGARTRDVVVGGTGSKLVSIRSPPISISATHNYKGYKRNTEANLRRRYYDLAN